MRAASRGAIVLVLALLVTAACSAGPSHRPPVATGDDAQPSAPAPSRPGVPPLGPATDGHALNWTDCTPGTGADLRATNGPAPPPDTKFACASMPVQLDAPNDAIPSTTRIALLSTGSGHIPLVVVGDAGGEPGTIVAAQLAQRMPPEMLSTFQIIGVDRRGTGQSDAPQCVPPPDRQTIVGYDPMATSTATLQPLIDSIGSATSACLGLGQRLGAYDAWRAASDLEHLRVELGVPRLHAIGIGEAARVLTTYAERFPASVGRMVLDGAPDPTADAREEAQTQAQTAEATFDAFAASCVSAGCPLGPDPRGAVSDLIQRARSAPLATSSGPVTAGTIAEALLVGLSDRSQWPGLATALAAANSGNGAPIAAVSAPLVRGDPAHPARLDADLITNCNDSSFRLPPQLNAQVAASWVHDYPLFGGVFAQRLLRCSVWPIPQQGLPMPNPADLPPVPVVTTALDPLTPAPGGQRMADQLGSVAVNWQSAGHSAIGQSSCATAAVSRFLVQGIVPAQDTVCPA